MKTKSTRIGFTDGLMEIAEKRDDIALVMADSLMVIKATPFAEKYPERTVDVGIAEQSAVGVAAGLASAGMVPFMATYAGFITMRACEQVRTFVGYPHLNVKLVGANGGIAGGEREGVTHQFFEDIAILRAIPGMTILVPADADQVQKAVVAAAQWEGPVYIRIGSGRDPVVYEQDLPFEIGKARNIYGEGGDVALFTCGLLINQTMEAAKELEKEGINAQVVEVHTIKPLDEETVGAALKKSGAGVTVEDHNVNGGLGSAVCELSAKICPVPVERIGLQDVWPQSGSAQELIEAYGMDTKDIVKAAKRAISNKK